MGIGRFVYTPILPDMAQALNWGGREAGLTASANFIGYLAGALLMAWYTAHRRTVMLTGLLIAAASTLASGVQMPFAPLLTARFLNGVASALVMVNMTALTLEQLARLQRPAWSSLYFSGVGTGITLSALVVALAHAWMLDWQWQWWIAGACITALAVLSVIIAPRTAVETAQTVTVAVAPAGRLGLLALSYGLVGFGYVITATFIVAIVRADEGLRTLESLVWLCVGLSAASSIAFWAWGVRRIGVIVTYAGACFLEALGIATGVLWPSAAGVLLAAVSLGGTFVSITALGLMAARERSPGNPARAIGLMTASFGTGQIIGPLLAGVLRDTTGSYAAPSLLATAALCLAATLAVWMRRQERRA